jgi:glycerol kinase
VLEAACYQTRDVVEAMQADAGTPFSELRVDGGMARNDFFLQLQADLPRDPGGAPCHYRDHGARDGLSRRARHGVVRAHGGDRGGLAPERRFEPVIPQGRRDALYAEWKQAVARARLRPDHLELHLS